MSRAELASMLRRFIGDEPNCAEWEWDDFISVRAEPELEPFRRRLLSEVNPYLGKPEKATQLYPILHEVIADLEASA